MKDVGAACNTILHDQTDFSWAVLLQRINSSRRYLHVAGKGTIASDSPIYPYLKDNIGVSVLWRFISDYADFNSLACKHGRRDPWEEKLEPRI